MGEAPMSQTATLHDLVARAWARGEEGRASVRSLIAAIDAIAPSAVDQVHARRIGRALGLAER